MDSGRFLVMKLGLAKKAAESTWTGSRASARKDCKNILAIVVRVKITAKHTHMNIPRILHKFRAHRVVDFGYGRSGHILNPTCNIVHLKILIKITGKLSEKLFRISFSPAKKQIVFTFIYCTSFYTIIYCIIRW